MTTQYYYRKGFNIVKFDASRINSAIAAASTIEQGEKFFWQSKYRDAYDFRPNVTEFDDAFIESLFDNEVPRLIAEMTAHDDLILSHCQLRHVQKTSTGMSYMSWHRDTYLGADEKWVGNTPPVHKLIVYPDLTLSGAPRLTVIPGSHRMMFDNPDMDIEVYKRLGLLHFNNMQQVHASNNTALLFNTSLMHHVAPEDSDVGSYRVIYSFMTRRQFDSQRLGDMELHRNIRAKYEEGL